MIFLAFKSQSLYLLAEIWDDSPTCVLLTGFAKRVKA